MILSRLPATLELGIVSLLISLIVGIPAGIYTAYRSLHYRHALKNTLVPVITIFGLQFGGIIAFSIVTESVFQ